MPVSHIFALVVAFLASLHLVCAADFYFTGSGSASFTALTNWRIGSIGGIIATLLPSTGDRVFITTDSETTVTFNPLMSAYSELVLGSTSSSNKQKLILTSALSTSTRITVQGGGVLEIDTGSSIGGQGELLIKSGAQVVQKGGSLSNNALVKINSGGEYRWESGSVSGNSNIEVDAGGVLTISGTAARTLSSKPLLVSGVLSFTASGDPVTFNSRVTVKSQGKLEWTGAARIEGSGGILVEMGGRLDISAATTAKTALINQGEIILRESRIFINETYTQTESTAHTIINDAEVIYDGTTELAFAAGNVTVSGTIRASGGVSVGGVFRGGMTTVSRKRDEVGHARIYGDFRVKSGAHLLVKAQSADNYDKVSVFGKAFYESNTGTYMRGLNGYIPRRGDEYTIVSHLDRDGTFDGFFAWGVFAVEYAYSPLTTRVTVTSSIAGGAASLTFSALAAVLCSVLLAMIAL